MAEPKKRTVFLTGLGETLEDRIQELREVRSATPSAADQAEIDQLVEKLAEAKVKVIEFCRAWSRSFDVYE